jgi:Beta-lactamase superfamily domain
MQLHLLQNICVQLVDRHALLRLLLLLQRLTADMAQEVDYIVVTQGLADHCCDKTLAHLSEKVPASVKVLAPPSARKIVSASSYNQQANVYVHHQAALAVQACSAPCLSSTVLLLQVYAQSVVKPCSNC